MWTVAVSVAEQPAAFVIVTCTSQVTSALTSEYTNVGVEVVAPRSAVVAAGHVGPGRICQRICGLEASQVLSVSRLRLTCVGFPTQHTGSGSWITTSGRG